MSLAIAENRQPQQRRAGGCGGIFFQLLDWNRRLAKKKLFSKKFLPPVRAVKSASKGFSSADDKMPVASKLLLIADENRGGFPSTTKPETVALCSSEDRGNRMHAPGLVARLMGLESMPVVQPDKPRKALDSDSVDDRSGGCGYARLDQGLCREQGKLESRPQKLQKTGGLFERRGVVGAPWLSPEVLGKTMFAQSRRQHRQLASPVRSPRSLSRSSTARLVQAASKILEPGLQNRNRAITYTVADADESDANLVLKNSMEPDSDSLVGSCKSCGSLVEVSDLRLGSREPAVTDNGPTDLDLGVASSSHKGSEEGKIKASVTTGRRNGTVSLAVQARVNVQSRTQDLPERMHYLRNDQGQHKPWQDTTSKSPLRRNNARQNQLPEVKDKAIRRTSSCSRKLSGCPENVPDEAKKLVAFNRIPNDNSRTRLANRAPNDLSVEAERIDWEKNTARKRRPISCPPTNSVGATISSLLKQRSVRHDSIDRKGTAISINRSTSHTCIDSDSWKKVVSSCDKDNGIVSFTFSSPMRRQSKPTACLETMQKNRGLGKLPRDPSHTKKLASDAKIKNTSSQREKALRGGQLSNLLEQKIKELNSLDQNELATGYALSERSTASILEELISALTTEASVSHNGGACTEENSLTDNAYHGCDNISNCTMSDDQMLANDMEFKGDEKAGISTSFLTTDREQPSPISILDAPFSNDSCSLGSPSCSSGSKPLNRLTEFCDKERMLDLDNDLLDSATSVNVENSGIGKIPRAVDENSGVHNSRSRGFGISETKLISASEAILNAELLLKNACLHGSSVGSFLTNTLEGVLDDFYVNSSCSSGFAEAKELLFDSIVELLDSKYRRFCKSGYRAWLKMSACLRRDWLVREVHEEIRGWTDFAGRSVDDLIDNDFSLTSLKWTQFESEIFVAGNVIEHDILKSLVDEVVFDLCL